MSLAGILVLLFIAAISGAIAQALVGFSLGGWFVSILVGLVGAFVGWWIAITFDFPPVFQISIQGRSFPVLWSIIGGVIFVSLMALIGGHR